MRAPWIFLALTLTGCSHEPTRATGLAADSAVARSSAAPPPTHASPIAADGTDPTALRYLEQVSGGASETDRLPIVVALHGYGDKPEAFRHLFDAFPGRARFVFPYGDPSRMGYAWWPITAEGPSNAGEGCERASTRIVALFATLAKAHPFAGKPVVTGFSQGGMISFALAALHPEPLGAVLPVSGLLPPSLHPLAQQTSEPLALFALHGTADPRVSIDRARESVEALKKVGVAAQLHEYPGVGHTISDEMRRDLFAGLARAIAHEASRP